MTRTEKKLTRLASAIEKLGIHFCPVCDAPHNTRSQLVTDLDGYLHFHNHAGKEFYVCAKCTPDWLKSRKRMIHRKDCGLSICSWILEQRVYTADHPHHEIAIELCAGQDLRFDLLLWRQSHAARKVFHGRTESELLESLNYRWNEEARAISQRVLDYIDHVRSGGKAWKEVWPPELEAAA